MKSGITRYWTMVAALAVGGWCAVAQAQLDPGVTYQGQLKQDGVPVTSTAPGCSFTFRLFDALEAGNQVGPDVVRRIWPEFTQFCQVKHRLDPSSYTVFESELRHVEGAKA